MPSLTTPPGPSPIHFNPIALTRYFLAARRNIIDLVKERFETFGDIYYAPFMGTELYVIRHPDHIQQVLLSEGSNFEKTTTGNAARQLRTLLGEGLLNSNGAFWKKQRRMINPAFRRPNLAAYAEFMNAYTHQMLDGWSPGRPFDLSREMMELTLRIVSKALFDHDAKDDADTVAEAMKAFQALVGMPAFLPAWVPFTGRRKVDAAVDHMNDLIYGLIDERLAQGTAGRGDLLSLLVEAVDPEDSDTSMTRKQLRDEILTMFLAGHETTSHALTWTFYLLSQNREARQRLLTELDEVLGGRDATVADLKNLPWLDQVLSESMRLYPPAFVISRTAVADTRIGEFDVPAGAEVLVWIYMTHHDPRFYPEPERFDPERFAPEAVAARPRMAYLPFGGGTRTCIGKHFSLMEAKLILATVLQRYELEHVRGHVVDTSATVTLSPKHGMQMIARRRAAQA